MKSTPYHEAVPGHHFQLTNQQESQELPRYRKLGVFGFNAAYIEGWALCAERLTTENGWYESDLPGRLGCLQLQLFRARRLVADTGLHAKKWTRQQVIDYGFTPQETECYIVWPGQACSYMIGQLRILELREQAKAALGAKFSIKEFHTLVLRGGPMPLAVLAQEVDACVAARKAGGWSRGPTYMMISKRIQTAKDFCLNRQLRNGLRSAPLTSRQFQATVSSAFRSADFGSVSAAMRWSRVTSTPPRRIARPRR